jgi:hypothetical protein
MIYDHPVPLPQRLHYLCRIIPPLSSVIDEETFSKKPAPYKWSKKEILRHLVDSANNNHQRFVRAQFEDVPAIFYDQHKWKNYGCHNRADSKNLVALWTAYNMHFAEIISRIPEESLGRECKTGENEKHGLEFLINDYVIHLEHHLRQMVNYT